MSEPIMQNSKIASKVIKPNKYILINDAGIGSNRLVMSNHYLNTFNYYHKNLIKMNKILELKNAERKKLEEKFRKDKEIPGLMFSSAYYKYTGNDFEYFENDKNNIDFKKAKINYLQDYLNKNEKTVKLKINIKNNKNKDEYIYKNLKLSEDLMHDDILNKDKIYTFNYNKKSRTLHNDGFFYSTQNNKFFTNKNNKYKIIFGKTEYQKKDKHKKRYLSYNKNTNINNEYIEETSPKQNLNKEIESKYNKIKLINKQKMLPLIN